MASAVSLSCAGCLGQIKDKQYIRCSGCTQYFDLLCANVSEQRFYNTLTGEHKEKWKCPMCVAKQPRTDNTNTPVRMDGVTLNRGTRGAFSPPDQMDFSDASLPLNDSSQDAKLENISSKTLVSELRMFREEMAATRLQMQELNGTMSEMMLRMNACEHRVNSLEERMTALERRVENLEGSSVGGSGDASLAAVEQLRHELNEREQDLLANDVQISGIPEEKGENLYHIVTTLATKIGVTLAEHDVVCVTRVGPPPAPEPEQLTSPSVSKPKTPSRPRPIVVRLARRVVRDKMLHEARVRRKADTEGTGLPAPPQQFYINERLTRTNRQLFQRARDITKRLKWRYAWTKDGRVFVRQKSDTLHYRLRGDEDFVRVFGSDVVCAPKD